MLLPRQLTTLAAAALAVLSSVDAAAKMDGWYTCSEWSLAEQIPVNGESSIAAQCAIFKAPLCYEGVCKDASNTEVDIFVKRYMSGDGEGNPNVIFMQGGPGAASSAMEDGMASLYNALGGKVNVFTMDHRGTGRSTLLDCVANQAQTSASLGGSSIAATEVASCAKELESRYGSDLAAFSVTTAANDLKYFITNFLKGTTYVYGVSYGTLLVERLMHLETPNVGGYILDGIATTSGASLEDGLYMSKWDLNMNEVALEYFARCDADTENCGKYFKSASSLEATLKSLMDEYDSQFSSNKCTDFLLEQFQMLFGISSDVTTPGPVLRQFFSILIKSLTMRKMIPVMTYRLNRCNSDDKLVLGHFFDVYSQLSGTVYEDDLMSSSLLYGLIVYSELWESPSPTDDEAAERFLNGLVTSYAADVELFCAFTKDTTSRACSSYKYTVGDYSASPIAYEKDSFFNKAASPPDDVSVLLLSGKLDPQTPHKYAETLYNTMVTTNKKIVAFDYATHATLWTTPMASSSEPTCGIQILASYVDNAGDLSKVDTSCVDRMPKLSFTVSKNSMIRWLNTTDAYDGPYVSGIAAYEEEEDPAEGGGGSTSTSTEGSSSSSYLGVFIAAAVAFVIAAVVAGVFLVKWRRAKKESESSIKEVNVYTESTV